jgi:hypothetical protein
MKVSNKILAGVVICATSSATQASMSTKSAQIESIEKIELTSAYNKSEDKHLKDLKDDKKEFQLADGNDPEVPVRKRHRESQEFSLWDYFFG